jgi:molybdenum cofactor guanylyltransferase
MRRSALILAGGKSSRMSVEKATLPFGNRTFFQCVFEVCERTCNDVLVAVGAGGLEDALQRLPFEFNSVGDPGEGPLVAIAAHLQRFEYVFVTACDTPMLQPALVELLFRCAEGNRGAVPFVGGRPQATCAVYSGDLWEDATVLVHSGERRVSALFGQPGVVCVEETDLRAADPDLRSFRGCNTPEEYLALLEFAGQPIPYEFLDEAGVQVGGQS